MKKILLFGILIGICILFCEDIYAAPSYTFERNERVDLRVACVDEVEQPCNSTIDCNITILRPDSTILVNNQPMTYGEVYYTYSIPQGLNTNIGIYSASIFCLGTGNGYSTFTYEVTESGQQEGIHKVALYIIIGISWVLFLIGMQTKDYAFTALAGILMLVWGVYIMINGLLPYNNYVTSAVGGIHTLLGGYLMIRSTYEIYVEM